MCVPDRYLTTHYQLSDNTEVRARWSGVPPHIASPSSLDDGVIPPGSEMTPSIPDDNSPGPWSSRENGGKQSRAASMELGMFSPSPRTGNTMGRSAYPPIPTRRLARLSSCSSANCRRGRASRSDRRHWGSDTAGVWLHRPDALEFKLIGKAPFKQIFSCIFSSPPSSLSLGRSPALCSVARCPSIPSVLQSIDPACSREAFHCRYRATLEDPE